MAETEGVSIDENLEEDGQGNRDGIQETDGVFKAFRCSNHPSEKQGIHNRKILATIPSVLNHYRRGKEFFPQDTSPGVLA